MAISDKKLLFWARDMGLDHLPLDRVRAFYTRRLAIADEARDAIAEITQSLDDAYRALFLIGSPPASIEESFSFRLDVPDEDSRIERRVSEMTADEVLAAIDDITQETARSLTGRTVTRMALRLQRGPDNHCNEWVEGRLLTLMLAEMPQWKGTDLKLAEAVRRFWPRQSHPTAT
jgi:hypothetical protein